jgi:hypothetical protein
LDIEPVYPRGETDDVRQKQTKVDDSKNCSSSNLQDEIDLNHLSKPEKLYTIINFYYSILSRTLNFPLHNISHYTLLAKRNLRLQRTPQQHE